MTNPAKLSCRVLDILSDRSACTELFLSAISPWEFCKLVEKRRVIISCTPQEWLSEALDMPGLTMVPLSPLIACRSTELPSPFHGDPADQIITSTARYCGSILITKDKLLQDYPHVKTVW